MNCEEVRERIVEFLDRALPDESQAAVDEHLLSCGRCRQEVAELGAAWEMLDAFPAVSPSGDFVQRTMTSFRSIRRGERKAIALRRAVLAVAAGLVLALSVFFFGIDQDSEPGSGPAVAEEEVIENLDLMEDLEFLEEFGEDLDMVMEYEIYVALSEEEAL